MEETAALYQFLYFVGGNTERFIDYSKLVDLYNYYLKSIATPSSKTYMQMYLLGQAVYGFSYLHDYIYEEEISFSYFELQNYIYMNDLRIRSLSSFQKKDLSIIDYNFIWSFACIDEMCKNGLEKFGGELIAQLKVNSYQIHKAYQKSIEGM